MRRLPRWNSAQTSHWLVCLGADVAHGAIVATPAFGKGRHPAGPNLGDCCAYAASAFTGEPLLFKGDDFARTEVLHLPW